MDAGASRSAREVACGVTTSDGEGSHLAQTEVRTSVEELTSLSGGEVADVRDGAWGVEADERRVGSFTALGVGAPLLA
jgi:hypothetical protein